MLQTASFVRYSPARIASIADVIEALDLIVQECARTQNRAGYFAALYKRMTIAVSEGIAKGSFEDGPRMEQLDMIFAGRYLAAFDAFQRNEACSTSWHCAFTGCGNRSLVVLQQLILGINTHINLDLAIAAAQIEPGEKIAALEKDFNNINTLIASLVDDIQHCLEEVWFPMRWIDKIANKQEQAVLNFNIGIARKVAWDNAVLLAKMNATEQAAHIKGMDEMVKTIGNRIINPGLWPQLLLRIIRFSEFGDVARTIRLIDTTVVN